MTKANDVALALAARLEEIREANGYATEAGQRVYRGRRRLDPAMIPCIVIGEGDDDVTANTLSNVAVTQRYVIEAHNECDPDHPNDAAHLLLGDLKRAIFGQDPSLNRTVRKIEYAGRMIHPREDGAAIVSASIEIRVFYVEDLTNP